LALMHRQAVDAGYKPAHSDAAAAWLTG